MAVDVTRLVGRYQLVVTEALLAFVERAFVLPAPASDRERVRAEALAEAQAAELEVDVEGYVASRAGSETFFRAPLRVAEREAEFDKPGGVRVRLRWEEEPAHGPVASLTASQPGKPDSLFVRKY